MRKLSVLVSALLCVTACQAAQQVDTTPLPTVAAPPYICEYVPQQAVELMTGVYDLEGFGVFDLTRNEGLGDGTCEIYRSAGERTRVLDISLAALEASRWVETQRSGGAKPLPEIVPGGVGYYITTRSEEGVGASAGLARGKSFLLVRLEIGVKGRDNAADVLALMKLIAPKLLTDASAPSAKTASPSPSSTKE